MTTTSTSPISTPLHETQQPVLESHLTSLLLRITLKYFRPPAANKKYQSFPNRASFGTYLRKCAPTGTITHRTGPHNTCQIRHGKLKSSAKSLL